jgi:large subunit ribosomal protein L21
MYAVLQQSGHQYRVSPGDRLLVDRLTAEVGSVVALEPVVLVVADDAATQVGTPVVDGVRVAATVVSHRKGAKLRVFKFKPKKHYRRTHGHRSLLTELRVEAVLAAGEALPKPKVVEPKAEKKAAAPKAKAAEAAPSKEKAAGGRSKAAAKAGTEATEASEAVDAVAAAIEAEVAQAPDTDGTTPDAAGPEATAPKRAPRSRAKKAEAAPGDTESETPAEDGAAETEA